jgi:hypothetical protein
MGSIGALLVKLISDVGACILHDFPRQVALEARKSESAGTRTGIINVRMTKFHDGDGQ